MVENASDSVKALIENAGNLAEIPAIAMMNLDSGRVEDGCDRRR